VRLLRETYLLGRLAEGEAAMTDKGYEGADEVAAYHATFFHVRDRLQASGYIRHAVIGPKPLFGLKEDYVVTVLKMYVYAHGPYFFDHLVDFYRNRLVMPERPEALPPEDFQRLKIKLLIRASILARVLLVKRFVAEKNWPSSPIPWR
jgi:hypothetical protein